MVGFSVWFFSVGFLGEGQGMGWRLRGFFFNAVSIENKHSFVAIYHVSAGKF